MSSAYSKKRWIAAGLVAVVGLWLLYAWLFFKPPSARTVQEIVNLLQAEKGDEHNQLVEWRSRAMEPSEVGNAIRIGIWIRELVRNSPKPAIAVRFKSDYTSDDLIIRDGTNAFHLQLSSFKEQVVQGRLTTNPESIPRAKVWLKGERCLDEIPISVQKE